MSGIIWWVGAAHVAAYAALGSLRVLSWAVWKAHTYGKYNAKVMQWHIARYRSQHRHTDGLTETEWAKGELKP